MTLCLRLCSEQAAGSEAYSIVGYCPGGGGGIGAPGGGVPGAGGAGARGAVRESAGNMPAGTGTRCPAPYMHWM